jgi:Holliday junction resolvase RusA-like endonuclease
MSNPTPRLRPKPGPEAIARLKLRILKAWQSRLAEIKEPKMKGRATRDFIELYNSGYLLPEGFTQPKHISRAVLYLWEKIYKKKGLKGLISEYRRRKRMPDNLVPMLPHYKKIVIGKNPSPRSISGFLSEIRGQWKWPPLGCPVMVIMRFFMAVPEESPMRARMKMLNHERPHLAAPHLDKLIDATKYLLRGIVWEDDSQIISLRAEKHYEWMKPNTEIFIRRLKG